MYPYIKADLDKEFQRIFNSEKYEPELWEYIKEFEEEFSSYCGSSFGAGTDSGTGALQLSLLASGVKHGDEVITVSNTYIATALAISNIGAKPVFVDIKPDTFNMNPEKIQEAITPNTKAIIPVHLYGQTADMGPILEIAKKNRLLVIEDACQAHAATYKGKKAGSMGDMGCFSFYSSKNISGFGNGGMIITDNRELIEKARYLRDPEANTPEILWARRTPAYLDSIQAAILKSKIKHLDSWNKSRREIARFYSESLEGFVDIPKEEKGNYHTFHSYVIRTKNRDKLKHYLKERGIETSIEYSPCIHLSKTFMPLGYNKGSLPETEKAEKEILSLPIYPYMKSEEISYIIKNIKEFFSS